MKRLYLIGLGLTTALSTAAIEVKAQDGQQYPSNIIAPYEEALDELNYQGEEILDDFVYYNDQREPCQNYRQPPAGFTKVGCDFVAIQEPIKVARAETVKTETRTYYTPKREVLTDYEVNFDFDSAALASPAQSTLDQAANDIKEYNPSEVTVAGFTDTAGPSSYNQSLSQDRAQAVSDALTERGISNRILDEEAYGESNLAVATDDNTPLRENRRVVVEFLK